MSIFMKHSLLFFLTGCSLFLTYSCKNKDNSLPSCDGVEYAYEGANGPEAWGQLCVDWTPCGGKIQSPVNLTGAVEDTALADIQLDYVSTETFILNKVSTVQITLGLGSECSMVLNGETYYLSGFHTHTHSEHAIKGAHTPMELHFVHKNYDTGRLAMIGVFVEEGTENAILKPMVDHLPVAPYSSFSSQLDIYNPIDLMPTDKSYFMYSGSLTTPPCTENVTWLLMEHPIQASAAQIQAFEALEHQNARPLQAIEGRVILHHKE